MMFKNLAKLLAVLQVDKNQYYSLLETNDFLLAASRTPPISIPPHHLEAPLTIEQVKKEIRKYVEEKPVKQVYLFGSVARQDHTVQSDLDLLIAFSDNYPATLMDIVGIKQDLEAIFHCNVDVVQEGSEHEFIRENIQKEKTSILNGRK